MLRVGAVSSDSIPEGAAAGYDDDDDDDENAQLNNDERGGAHGAAAARNAGDSADGGEVALAEVRRPSDDVGCILLGLKPPSI